MNDGAIFALLDDASPDASLPSRSRLYRDYAGMLACHTPDEWPALLARLQEALAAGLYAVPVLGYELGEQLLGIVPPAPADAQLPESPLAQVLLFQGYERCAATSMKPPLRARSSASATTSRPATRIKSTTPTGSASTPSARSTRCTRACASASRCPMAR
jgi:para-aminobenzoate synthetase/4-amino-4-deoxychorismate lyase